VASSRARAPRRRRLAPGRDATNVSPSALSRVRIRTRRRHCPPSPPPPRAMSSLAKERKFKIRAKDFEVRAWRRAAWRGVSRWCRWRWLLARARGFG